MDISDLIDTIADENLDVVVTPTLNGSNAPGLPFRTATFSTKIQTILGSSYTDLGTRDALETLDARQVKNDRETRRNLRLDVQREIIDCNGEIVQDFGQVAEVSANQNLPVGFAELLPSN